MLNLAEFIDVKGMKAQGNQMTKLKVKEILLEHEIEGDTPWPEEDKNDKGNVDSEEEDSEGGDDEEGSTTIEWDISKEDEDEKNQGRLF